MLYIIGIIALHTLFSSNRLETLSIYATFTIPFLIGLSL